MQFFKISHAHTHTHNRTVHYTDIGNYYLHGNNGTKYCAVWAIMSILYEALCSCLKIIHIIDNSTTEKRFPTSSTSLWLILNIFLPLHPCLRYVMRKYPWHITRISDVFMATMFATGHSVDEPTMELESGTWREMGRKCKWWAGACGSYSVSAFVLQDPGVPYFSRSLNGTIKYLCCTDSNRASWYWRGAGEAMTL